MSYPAEDVNGLVNLIADALTTVRPTLRIGGENIPTEQVRERMLSLEHRHLEYVFDSLCRNSTKIRNIRAYLLTALYNAPTLYCPEKEEELQAVLRTERTLITRQSPIKTEKPSSRIKSGRKSQSPDR